MRVIAYHCIDALHWRHRELVVWDDYYVIDWDNWTVDYAVYTCAYCTLLLMCIVIHMSYPSYCEHVDLLLTPTQLDVAGITGGYERCHCRVLEGVEEIVLLRQESFLRSVRVILRTHVLYRILCSFLFMYMNVQLIYKRMDVYWCSLLFMCDMLPFVYVLWDSFSGGAPVRSRPRLRGCNWRLIRRGCDKLVSERGL